VIAVSAVDGVGTIELNRPERRNALDVEHCRGVADGIGTLLAQGVRSIVVAGAGSSFCSGADFDEVYSDGFRDALHAALHAVTDAPVPVVAAVNGPAIGAGTQLAIACDLRVAAPEAFFAVPTARLGLAVDPWTVHRLAQLAGGATARALLLACEEIAPERALARGLVDRIGSRADAVAMATEMTTLAPLTLRYNKLALDRADRAADDRAAADPAVLAAFEACWSSTDLREGRLARADRRPPVFTGR
jgi:enoyl-CoA hydratase